VRKSGTISFGEAADKLIESMEPGWRNAKHRYQWRQTLNTYAAPLHATPVSQITTEQVLDVLKLLWVSKSVTAGRLRGRIERVLDWAKAHGHRVGENPARWKGHLANLLPRRQRLSRGHHPAMPVNDLPDFLAQVRAMDGIASKALEFTILTAARTGETLGARWNEVDFEEKLWVVPAQLMKAGREHRVPLSARVLRLLQELHEVRISDYMFPRLGTNRPLPNMALLRALQRAGITSDKASVHGFRSCFRIWAAESTTFPREVAEAALAHVNADRVEAAYQRSDLIEKRRKLMDAWAHFCAGSVARATVVPLIVRR
jgi:integrase